MRARLDLAVWRSKLFWRAAGSTQPHPRCRRARRTPTDHIRSRHVDVNTHPDPEFEMYDDPDPVPHPIRQQKEASFTGWAMGALQWFCSSAQCSCSLAATLSILLLIRCLTDPQLRPQSIRRAPRAPALAPTLARTNMQFANPNSVKIISARCAALGALIARSLYAVILAIIIMREGSLPSLS